MTTGKERRRDLRRAYKECSKPAGVFRIENTVSGRVLLGSSLNLDGTLNRHRFMLSIGSHNNAALQSDRNLHGAEVFVLEIVETVKVTQEPGFDLDDELTLLEQIWIERLDPLSDRG
jgi:hypothetical protein